MSGREKLVEDVAREFELHHRASCYPYAQEFESHLAAIAILDIIQRTHALVPVDASEGEIAKAAPIETVPKDGTAVLLYGPAAGEISGIDAIEAWRIGYYATGGDYDGFDWACSDGDAYAVWIKPSHWAKLPDPPKDAP